MWAGRFGLNSHAIFVCIFLETGIVIIGYQVGQRFSEIGQKGPLLFVTARPVLLPIQAWVEKMLSQTPFPVEVIATGAFEAKADVLKTRGIQFFVDDYLEICFMLEKHDITPIVFHQPWNRFPHPFLEVANWPEIRGIIDLSGS